MRARPATRAAMDAPILERIFAIKADHPLWGYRRVWAYMRFRDQIVVGKNRVYRLMSEHNRLVAANPNLRAKRHSTRPKPRSKVPNQFWGTDMTKVAIKGWGWVYVHVVIDWYSKEIIGHHVALTSKTQDWLDALDKAVQARFPNGILSKRGKPKLVSDNGSQPTSIKFMKTCSTLKIRQIFTTWNNPKGNADTERFFRTLKEDFVWSNDWHSPFTFEAEFHRWIRAYNTDFPHQSLNYRTPAQAFADFVSRKLEKREVVLT